MNIATAALRRLSVLAVGAALAAVVAGVASAAIPSATGTINACYDKQTGQARIVDPETNVPKKCGQKEAPVSWNVQGQPGPAGPAGPAGPSGVSGIVLVSGDSPVNSIGDKTKWVFCPAGKRVIGGGADVFGPEAGGYTEMPEGVALVQNGPMGEYGWSARATEIVEEPGNWYIKISAICANAN
ncbi:MAG TPA: hypothetical protein VFV72_13290 [Candidatus Limnocylindrales bacterium]|nr:hypothetical protein [Candidatus Limnocylindrales bacterium]